MMANGVSFIFVFNKVSIPQSKSFDEYLPSIDKMVGGTVTDVPRLRERTI